MSISELTSQKVPIKIWAPLESVESAALDQLKNVANLPQVFHHVSVMADVHSGKGATVGSVIAMEHAVSPATVGVDIGCGMGAVRTSLKASDLPDNLEQLRADIEAKIPVGFSSHDEPPVKGNASEEIKYKNKALFARFGMLNPSVLDLQGKARRQLGTLGGGNHFIELCLDNTHGAEDPNVWLMLHSGSRNIGKVLAEININFAKELSHNKGLIDKDLATFLEGTVELASYLRDLFWAQDYAFFNRTIMFELLREVIDSHFTNVVYQDPILCHHNYVSVEMHYNRLVYLTRKGAISAKQDELGIIPGSMGSKSFIVRGLGNQESFCSASHGAGRVMSRGKAKKSFTVEDLKEQTKGVCCRKDSGVLDEIPGAYKNILDVMNNQKDLVRIVTELKQVLCIKG